MPDFLITLACSFRLDEIYRYGLREWGEAKAQAYIKGMFEQFRKITTKEALSYPIPAEFEVKGFFSRYEQHFIYWRYLANGKVGIVTVLHKRMQQKTNLFLDAL